MSGPDGSITKRDQRREDRRLKLRESQAQRQRERARRIMRQRLQRGAMFAGTFIVVALVAVFVIHRGGSTPASAPGASQHIQYTTPANGDVRDGLSCATQEGQLLHFHVYLALYENGQQVTVPANTGITNTCIYPLHVHAGEADIIHIESATQTNYTLGEFFAIWGEPLTATQVGNVHVDSSHPLIFETVDSTGKVTVVRGDPWNIQLASHETIYILYNSPHVQATPYTNWGNL